ncbi:hypothetical protein [Lactococcus lactis]|uniref:hypothetical protein n=1 Tax=Lactococcus lactis TaxID=1358 RepID=UPI0037C888BF
MEKRTRDYKKNGSKKMGRQGKVLILALLAFLIFFVGFKYIIVKMFRLQRLNWLINQMRLMLTLGQKN